MFDPTGRSSLFSQLQPLYGSSLLFVTEGICFISKARTALSLLEWIALPGTLHSREPFFKFTASNGERSSRT